MTKPIRLKTSNILNLFLVNFVLFLFVQSIVTIDTENDTTASTNIPLKSDENNQTVINQESQSEADGKLPSDSIPVPIEKSVDSPISIEIPLSTNDEKSNNTQDPSTNLNIPSPVDEQESQSTTTPTSTKKTPPTINSFEEWKRQQLQSDSSKTNEGITGDGNEPSATETVPVSGSKMNILPSNGNHLPSNGNNNSLKKHKLRKNFASSSCGAKVLAHNSEAQNTNSILSSSPDEYMLNPCNAKIWFVIELCESVRISNIEIANFELFSSVPKTFRVYASDRFLSKDWHRHHLGTFNVSYNRMIQSFQPTETSKFAKYIKFELIDFHGREHFCPLSVVKIFGSNVEDEMITMEEKTKGIESLSSSSQPEDVDNEDDPSNSAQEQQTVGIGSAIIGIARQVFRLQSSRDTPSATNSPAAEIDPLKSDCAKSNLQISIDEVRLKSWRRTDSFKRCVARFVRGLWQKFDTCTNYFSQICFLSTLCCQCPLKPITINLRKSTTNIYRHSCGYYHLLNNHLVCKTQKIHRANETIPITNNASNESVLDIKDKHRINDEQTLIKSNESLTTFNSTFENLPSIQNETILNETTSTTNHTISLDNQASNLSNSTVSTQDVTKTDNNSTETTTADPTNTNSDGVASTNNIINQAETFPPGLYTQWLKGILVNTKSVPELFKIIEKLNFNLTLSNRYLQELSEHYLKKLEETQQTTDLLLNSSKEADVKFKLYEEQLFKLQRNFDETSFRLLKLEVWIPPLVLALIISIMVSIWSTCRLITYHYQMKAMRNIHNQFHTFEQIQVDNNELDENEDDEEDVRRTHYKMMNGSSRRKLSTDSTDSNLSRSRQVPDSNLSKIGGHGNRRLITNKRKSSSRTSHLVGLSAAQT